MRAAPYPVYRYSLARSYHDLPEDHDEAQQWMNDVFTMRGEPNTTSWNTVIKACAEAGDVLKAESWLDSLRQNPHATLRANITSYNIMIKAFAEAGDHVRAENMLIVMLEEGVKANTFSYSKVIRACAAAGEAQIAAFWLSQMQSISIFDFIGCYAK